MRSLDRGVGGGGREAASRIQEVGEGVAPVRLTRRGLLMGASAVAMAAAASGVPTIAPAAAAEPIVVQGPLTLPALKAHSERALTILQKHFPETPINGLFLAEEGENYHGLLIRCDCPERPGKPYRCDCGSHPLAGTPMIGGMSGYYEPEWDERTVYEVFRDVID